MLTKLAFESLQYYKVFLLRDTSINVILRAVTHKIHNGAHSNGIIGDIVQITSASLLYVGIYQLKYGIYTCSFHEYKHIT